MWVHTHTNGSIYLVYILCWCDLLSPTEDIVLGYINKGCFLTVESGHSGNQDFDCNCAGFSILD